MQPNPTRHPSDCLSSARRMSRQWVFAFMVGLFVILPASVQAQRCGPLEGEGYTYPNMNLAPRTVTGAFAIPAGMGGWDGLDWGVFAGFGTTTAVLMTAGDPTLDVRFQDWVQDNRSDEGERFFIHVKSAPMFGAFVGYTTVMAGIGWIFDRPDVLEYTSLMLEAVAIVQFYHVVTKFLIGREGPYQGNGLGEYHGPTRVSFPGGTPSGHVATIYAVIATAAEYYDSVPLTILTHGIGIYVGASLIYHNQHYISDVIWGAAMGYYVARWVVRHHSSRYDCGEPIEPYTTWMPVALGEHGFGLAVTGSF